MNLPIVSDHGSSTMIQMNGNLGSQAVLLAPIASDRDQKQKEQFFKLCIEALLMDKKDRTTVSGQNKLAESLNKLLLNHTEIAKWLLLKRVNEITQRMILVTLKPGQHLDLDDSTLYIVIDGMVRVATHDQIKQEGEAQELQEIKKKRLSQLSMKSVASSIAG